MTDASSYQVLLLGAADKRAISIRKAITERVIDLGLPSTAIRFLSESESVLRSAALPTIALFFGSSGVIANKPLLADLLAESIVIVPIVTALTNVSLEVPKELQHINAIALSPSDDEAPRIASLVLELFRLLRAERRIFISYKRSDSQPLAEKLYDELDARGFDVFIDLRSVPPAADFQSVLWHRMADSDVIVLIDTAGFRSSRWTTAELAQANATSIQILHILWPGQAEDSASAFSHFVKLQASDFKASTPGRGSSIKAKTLKKLCNEAERLRARAIAMRYRHLIDNFCDAARDTKLQPAVQPERWILLEATSKGTLAVVPAIGVPTSDRINKVFDALQSSPKCINQIWLIYDNRGILTEWLAHLDWLSSHLPVRSVRMAAVPDELRAL